MTNNEIILVDTNIVYSDFQRKYFDSTLNVKDRKDSIKFLTANDNLRKRDLENLINQNKVHLKNIFKENGLITTRGVIRQSNPHLDNTINCIKQRGSSYTFLKLNPSINSKREEINYKLLTEYKNQLEQIKKNINENEFSNINPNLFFDLTNLVYGINTFQQLGKNEHKQDYGTDVELITTILYQSLLNKNVKVYCNDRDILENISFIIGTLKEIPHIYSNNPELKSLTNNYPEFFNSTYDKTNNKNTFTPIDLKNKYQELNDKFQKNMSSAQNKEMYNRTIGKFGFFLQNTTNNIIDSIERMNK